MAYFSNGTEGLNYQSRFCERCVHYKYDEDTQTEGCPIWDLHFLYNYRQVKFSHIRRILAMLNPMTEDKVNADRCNLFYPNGDIEGQIKMDFVKE